MQKREFHQVARTGRPRIWTIEVDGNLIVTEHGELGGKLQRVVDEGQRKNVGRANEITPEQDAAYLAERAILEKVRTGYTEEGTERADSIDWFSTLPINLRFYKPDNSLSTTLAGKLANEMVWLSRKRDGEMVPVLKGPDSGVDIYSRRMLRTHHLEEGEHAWRDRFPDLVKELEGRADIPPRTILLGDLVHSPTDDGRWAVASIMKSRTKEALQQPPLFYYVWDIAFWDGVDLISQTSIADRYALIWDTFGRSWSGDSLVLPVEAWEIAQLRRMSGVRIEDPVEMAQAASKKWGWEGWVVVDPAGVYGDRAYNFRGKTDRPGKFCGKLKPVYEDDFVALFDPDGAFLHKGPQGKWGTGNNRGMVGSVALYQYTTDGKLVYVCDCGGGIDDAFRARHSDPRGYPLVLQVEYTDRTYTSEGEKTNALTYPRVLCARTDKEPEECVNPRL